MLPTPRVEYARQACISLLGGLRNGLFYLSAWRPAGGLDLSMSGTARRACSLGCHVGMEEGWRGTDGGEEGWWC